MNAENVELIRFMATDGLQMHGLLSRSRRRNSTAIITIFGMTGDFFSSRWPDAIVKDARGTRFDVFRPANRGMGSVFQFKERSGKSVFIGTARERFEDCVYDISGAVKALKSNGYDKILLAGHSTGCQKAAYYMWKTRDRCIGGVMLLSPVDDYNSTRAELGKRFKLAVSTAKRMVKAGKGNDSTPDWISYYSAKRFLSYAIAANPEARMFNYDSKMREFGSIRVPVLAVFGSAEEHATKPIEKHISLLKEASGSKAFRSIVVPAADHSFHGKEEELAKAVVGWAKKLPGT